MNETKDSGMSTIVVIVGIIAIAFIAYVAVEFVRSQQAADKPVIDITLPGSSIDGRD